MLRSRAAGHRRTPVLALLLLVVSAVAFLAWNDVPSKIAPLDVKTAVALMAPNRTSDPAVPFVKPQGFEAELALIIAVQDAVLRAAPIDEGLPLDETRELSELVKAGRGLCYDRSHAIETILRLHGMETRHVAVYSTETTASALRSLLTPQVSSHALSEVLTERGWIAVDSNYRWIALTADGEPYDLGKMRQNPNVAWSKTIKGRMAPIFKEDYTWVYGLFSRHGRFYPPFIPFPDIKLSELRHNIF